MFSSFSIKSNWYKIPKFCIIFSIIILIPLEIAFFDENLFENTKLIWFLKIFFLIDIIFKFIDPSLHFKNKKKIEIFNIYMNYIKSDFLSDSLALLQFFIINDLFDNENNLIKLLKLLFLLKLKELKTLINQINNYYILNLMINFIFAIHLFTCSFLFVANINIKYEYNINDYSFLMMKSKFFQYMLMFNKSIKILIPSGNINSIFLNNEWEICLEIIIICLSILFYLFNLPLIYLFLKNQINILKNQIYYKNIHTIFKNGSWEKKDELNYYLKNLIENNQIINEIKNSKKNNKFFNYFNSEIKHKLLDPIIYDKISFFNKNFESNILEKLADLYEFNFFLENEEISFKNIHNDLDSYLHFIVNGNVGIYLIDKNIKISSLNQNEIFGFHSFLTTNKEDFSYKALSSTILLSLKKSDFINLLKQSNCQYQTFLMIKEKYILYRDISSLHICCNYCKKNDHILNKCPSLQYIPNPFEIFFKSKYNATKVYLRKNRKYNSLKNKKLTKNTSTKICYLLNKFSFNTFLSSKENNRSLKDQNSFDKISTIKLKNSLAPLSSSSRCNDILLMNCLNSPFNLKKVKKPNLGFESFDKFEKSGSSLCKNYRDSYESNRVYYEKSFHKEESMVPIVETIRSLIVSNSSEKIDILTPTVFKAETGRTSGIIEDYQSNLTSFKDKASNLNSLPSPTNLVSNLESNYQSSVNTKFKSNKNKKSISSKRLASYDSKNLLNFSQKSMKQFMIDLFNKKNMKNQEKKFKNFEIEFEKGKDFESYFENGNLSKFINNLNDIRINQVDWKNDMLKNVLLKKIN